MFIRWKRRQRSVWVPLRGNVLAWTRYLYLCESRRVDGRPRQRVIGYLGGFQERYAHDESNEGIQKRLSFWWRADQWLEDRELMDEKTCNRLQAKIAEVVPRPDEQALSAYKARMEREIASLRSYERAHGV